VLALSTAQAVVYRHTRRLRVQTVLAHIRVDHPPGALTRALVLHADEAIVQREIVADGVLPAGAARPVELLFEVGHVLDNPVVDLREREPLLGTALDRARDQLSIRKIPPRVLTRAVLLLQAELELDGLGQLRVVLNDRIALALLKPHTQLRLLQASVQQVVTALAVDKSLAAADVARVRGWIGVGVDGLAVVHVGHVVRVVMKAVVGGVGGLGMAGRGGEERRRGGGRAVGGGDGRGDKRLFVVVVVVGVGRCSSCGDLGRVRVVQLD